MIVDRRALLAGAGAVLAVWLAPRAGGGARDERGADPRARDARGRQLRRHDPQRTRRADPRNRAAGARARSGGASRRAGAPSPSRGGPARSPSPSIFSGAPRRRSSVARSDRHFFGHGAYSADGKLLFATENDFEASAGRDRRLRRHRRLWPHRRVSDARHRHARGDPASRREDAGDRQWRDRDDVPNTAARC